MSTRSAFHAGVQAMVRMFAWHQPIGGPTPEAFSGPDVLRYVRWDARPRWRNAQGERMARMHAAYRRRKR